MKIGLLELFAINKQLFQGLSDTHTHESTQILARYSYKRQAN